MRALILTVAGISMTLGLAILGFVSPTLGVVLLFGGAAAYLAANKKTMAVIERVLASKTGKQALDESSASRERVRDQFHNLSAAEKEAVKHVRHNGHILAVQVASHLASQGFAESVGVIDSVRSKTPFLLGSFSGEISINPELKELLDELVNPPLFNPVVRGAASAALVLFVIGCGVLFRKYLYPADVAKEKSQSSSASQSVTPQQIAPTAEVQQAIPTQPSETPKKNAERRDKSAKASEPSIKPAQQAALREATPKQDVKPAGANMDALASVMAGHRAPMPATSPQSRAKGSVAASPPPPGMIACANGKFVHEHHAEECGASNLVMRYNSFEGGATPPNLSGTYNASINNNLINGPGPQAPPNQPNKLEVKDPGTSFTHNTVKGMDASISNGAEANSNLFEGQPKQNITVPPGSIVSINQQGGQTANTINNYAPPQRTVDHDNLVACLSAIPGKINFGALTMDPASETHKFAVILREVFRSAHWMITKEDIDPLYNSTAPEISVIFNPNPTPFRNPPNVNQMAICLRRYGNINQPLSADPRKDWDDSVTVVVGPDPHH